MDAKIDNLATKPSSLYYGSVNVLVDEQKFSVNFIYLHPDVLWFYYQ